MALQPGFSPLEALGLLTICYSINCNRTGVKPGKSIGPVNLPAPPDPDHYHWELDHDPGKAVLADNYWQIWKNTEIPGQYALAFRGTTTNADSAVEDVAIILVHPHIDILGHKVKLARNHKAKVHAGHLAAFAALMVDDIFLVLEEYVNLKGMTDLLLVGHSQGAALATLCHAFLHYQDIKTLLGRQNLRFKTYGFAQPKVGNTHFMTDFEYIAAHARQGAYEPMAFRVNSDQDWAPQAAPLTIQMPRDASKPNPFSVPDFISPKVSEFFHDIEKYDLHLDFQGAGIQVILRAEPGTNPDNPDDIFWQHHAQHYYQYLKKQYS
jgi:hypothetical protein